MKNCEVINPDITFLNGFKKKKVHINILLSFKKQKNCLEWAKSFS